LYQNRREAGDSFVTYPFVVYLYFLSYTRFAGADLYDPGFLDQYQELYFGREA